MLEARANPAADGRGGAVAQFGIAFQEGGHMVRSRAGRTAVAVLLMGAMAVACSKEQRQDLVEDTVELAARNIAKAGGEQEFRNEGVEVAGDLECSATSDAGAQTVSVNCTGSSVDGQALTVEGELAVADGEIVDSSGFVGTADGDEVFQVACVGEACSVASSADQTQSS
jgi:hypothetical protein